VARGSAFHAANRGFREPDGQAPALAQGDVIGGPIRHSVPLLRDVMTAILVGFEWHGDCPGSGTGPPSYTVHSSPPNDRSVQQGHGGAVPVGYDLHPCRDGVSHCEEEEARPEHVAAGTRVLAEILVELANSAD